jgi:hypothetical protein
MIATLAENKNFPKEEKNTATSCKRPVGSVMCLLSFEEKASLLMCIICTPNTLGNFSKF